ncbi:hypothetical protein BY996DRAFT_6565265 [Phakopsora pachyrhizi]|nr:hypothetical protein BY996DRAFT_6565265 [Phakopsora pachyrhizi]
MPRTELSGVSRSWVNLFDRAHENTSWMSNAGNAKANGVNPNGVLDKVAYPFSKQCYWSGKDMKNLESFNFCGNKQIAAQYRDLINSYISPRQIILHNENKEKLALLNRNLKELSPEDKEALELWASKNFQPNNVLIENESPNEFQSAKAALEWNLKRASAKQDVWWTKEDLQRWAHHDSDETVIIKFGDILKFDQKREDFVIKDINKTNVPVKHQQIMNLKKSRFTALGGNLNQSQIQQLNNLKLGEK